MFNLQIENFQILKNNLLVVVFQSESYLKFATWYLEFLLHCNLKFYLEQFKPKKYTFAAKFSE